MKLLKSLSFALLATVAMSSISSADTINIDALTITSAGYGPPPLGVTGTVGASHAGAPTTLTATSTGFDIDGDAVNDSFSFDIIASTNSANGVSVWGQGINVSNAAGTDTSFGFGAGNNVTFSVGNIVGMSSLGETITFDGFTGAGVGLGNSNAQTASLDINGNNVTAVTTGGGFQFVQAFADFAATPTVTFSNEVKTGGAFSARTYDLQFSSALVVPEPGSLALLGLAGLGLVTRRRRS